LESPARSGRVIVTVIGQDRVGIIAAVATLLAEADANILDISQTLLQDMFTMIMIVDTQRANVPLAELKQRLARRGAEMGLQVEAQHEDVFKFMHRV
jgi:ACT domain-containing protein